MPFIWLTAFLPAILIVYIIHKIDDFQEPAWHLFWSFIAGVISPAVTLVISNLLDFGLTQEGSPWSYALLMAAIPEELGRLLILLLICAKWKEVAEPFDCIVYGASIWAGFSAIENLMYALQAISEGKDPFVILSIRSTLCTLGHVSWGVILGAFVGIHKFGTNHRKNWIMHGLMISIALHMAYDALLFTAMNGDSRFWNKSFALAIDAFSFVIALLLIIRMEEVQGIALDEGHKASLQANILKRHRPLKSIGMYEIITNFGFGGLFFIIAAFSSTSMMIYYLNMIFIKVDQSYLMNVFISGGLGLWFWKLTLSRIVKIHELSDDELDEELDEAIGKV